MAIQAHSSSGLGRRPLKAEITGSNPVCATTIEHLNWHCSLDNIIHADKQAYSHLPMLQCVFSHRMKI